MGAGLTFTQYEASASPNGAPTTPPGGGWAANTISVHVVPNYHPTGLDTDIDTQAWDRSSPALWSGIVVAGSDQLVVPFNTPTRGAGGNRIYDMSGYRLCYQIAAIPDWTLPWTIVSTQSNPMANTITAADDVSLGTITANATSTIITASQVVDIPKFIVTKKTVQTYTGTILRRTLTNRAAVRQLSMTFPGGAMTHSQWSRLLKWISLGTFLRVSETEEGNAERDAPIRIYEGVLVDTDYINSLYKNRKSEYTLVMDVESTTASAQVP